MALSPPGSTTGIWVGTRQWPPSAPSTPALVQVGKEKYGQKTSQTQISYYGRVSFYRFLDPLLRESKFRMLIYSRELLND